MCTWACTNQGGGLSRPPTAMGQRGGNTSLYMPGISWGMPCTQCAHSAKFWMSTNTRTLLLAHLTSFWFHAGVFLQR